MFLHFLQKKEHKEAFLEIAHLVAKADGFVHRKEQGYLRAYRDEMKMPESDYEFTGERELADIIGDLKEDQVKNIFFAEILLLTFADGDYNDAEKQITQEMKRLFGFTDETYGVFKDWVIRMDKLKIEGMRLILDPS
ncbi:TerB family tellurite resistance protein [Paenibacillus oenotherae]|uniref:TerB family tellurite resistance protein n=1 Tax=Paenibacillus oenotherae TaxID=1435645 RepID=A0ABS7DCA7_9BACL|nr:TerB family tellurite resistance protein [Paenibacillus oenotherae]MBW7477573.1 TerB family tellurite resistance protein [Paenibacillus oenotherae]